MATQPKMTREEFLAKYGNTFVADDKGGNAASEVAGMDVGNYYDMFLGPDARKTYGTSEGSQAWDNTPLQWGNGNYGTNNPNFDGFDNVNPHPVSERLDGFGEAWKAVGRPIATMAAMYAGANGLEGLLGTDTAAMGVNQVGAMEGAANPFANLANLPPVSADPFSVASLSAPEVAGAGGFTFANETIPSIGKASLADLGGAGATTGGLSLANLGNKTLSQTVSNAFGPIGEFVKDNASLVGAGLGALASGDTQTKSSSSKDPWAPAQPYLLDNLKTNANMQEYYRANPFSTEQKTAYQGLLNTLANNNANVPGLLANASSFGQSNRGKMPAMQGLLSGTQAAPIDWAQYQNIGRK